MTTATTDLAEARLLGEQAYYPHRLSLAGSEDGMRMRMRAHDLTPDVTIGELGYRAPVRLDCGDLGGYQVNVPQRGTARSHCGDQQAVADPRQGAVFTPGHDSAIELWNADCVQYGVRMTAPIMTEILHQNAPTGRSSARFRHEYPLDTASRRSWVKLVATTLDLISALPEHGRSQAGPHLARSLVVAFLHSAEHDLREDLDRPGRADQPKLLRRAVRYIEADPAAPLDVAALAVHCRVSVRTLQYEFARRLGTSPSAYRRSVALEHAHADLRRADPACTTVADVACRWGFFHLGRFARDHHERYGTRPAEVLRGD
ncbi:AraC family transcriptional regulator [Pseudonocardia sp. GCM10023141]|uniref:AraC family transcriptional regulator n=1 Tax=Pseudonocardia sp. GCM10023141 TaxID=3252653 RepID=UPI00361FB92F